MFKRRDRRPIRETLTESVWPRRGWGRVLQYFKHRLSRLPDQPARIARGVFAGVFVSFTPLFGLHFVLAAAIAWVIRGNVLAALLGTFFGNPLTFVVIAAVSLKIGSLMLGHAHVVEVDQSVFGLFMDSISAIYHNLLAPFTGATADWSKLDTFMSAIFYPYLLGGTVAGIFFGWVSYALTLPLVRAYQRRRQAKMMKKWKKLREKAATNVTIGEPPKE